MSTRILILKDGIITPSRSPTDISNVRSSLGVVDLTTNQIIAGNKTFSGVTSVSTATPGTNTTQAASTAFVINSLSSKADLVGGVIPASQLPSYVDDVLEFANLAGFPTTGETGKIYVAIDTNLTYRWTGSIYSNMSSSLALGTTSTTAYRGDFGNTAYNHSQIITGNPHQLTAATLGLGNVDNTSDINKPLSTSTQNALNLKANLVSPSFTTPNLGTPSGGVMTNATGLPLATGVVGILSIANGGTNSSTQNWVDLTTTQNISGNKYFLNSILVGTDSSSVVQPYTNTDIKSINTLQVINSINGSVTLSTNPSGTFAFVNNDFNISSNSSTAITSQFLGGHYRLRNYATALYSNIQGLRLSALNSGTGNITQLDGAVFTARNDTATTVTTINGGNFVASIGNIAGTSTTINGGLFTVSSGAAATSTTIRGISVIASSSNTTPATNCIGIEIADVTGTAINKFALKTGIGVVFLGDTTVSTSTTTGALIISGGVGSSGNIFSGGTIQGTHFQVTGVKVIGARDTGWTAPTGTTNKGVFASETATLLDVARRVFSLETALRNHGLIGT